MIGCKRRLEHHETRIMALCCDRYVKNVMHSAGRTSAGQCPPTLASCHALGKRRALNPVHSKKPMTSFVLRK